MTDLPHPSFAFRIPSVDDDTDLECRIYNPHISAFISANGRSGWQTRGAIIAHPYAPLGGCYDDPVVLSLVEEILKQDFVVGTFNLRGAGNSNGSTSWTAKGELQDYMSFAGLFIHYLHHIQTTLSTLIQSPQGNRPQPMTLILGGYSYGSLLTTHLPPTPAILTRFSNPENGTAAAEIRLRAHHLASEWHRSLDAHSSLRDRPIPSSQNLAPATITLGGEESTPGSRRMSHDGRRSMEAVRKSIDKGKQRLGLRQHSDSSSSSSRSEPEQHDPDAEVAPLEHLSIPEPRTSYLLISPLLPPISSLATMFSSSLTLHKKAEEDRKKSVICNNPTLAVYGDRDIFTSLKKMRRWVQALSEGNHGTARFRSHEVVGAGHFWREQGVEREMRRVVGDWIRNVVLLAV